MMELDDGWNFLHEAAARLSGHTSSSSSAVAGSGGAAAAAASGGSSAIRMGENVRVPHTAKAAAEQLWETTQQQQQQQHDDDVDVWDEAEKQRDLQWEAGMKVCSLIADGLGWSLLFE